MVHKTTLKKPTLKDLEARVALLEQKMDATNDVLDGLQNLDAATIGNSTAVEAKVTALMTMVFEIAAQMGIEAEAFYDNFNKRTKFWHDELLRRAENLNPGFAAAIDSRSPLDAETETMYPPLFDEPET